VATIDEWLEGLMHEPVVGAGIVLVISLLLGLRHASDPDHLAAVTTLIASEEDHRRIGKAGLMGLLWGTGHATTLILVGLPLVLAGIVMPEPIQQVAETLIGVIIIFLAARLLLRWRRGLYHVHTHSHDRKAPHRHVHSHAHSELHEHTHSVPRRTPFSAYGVGLVHGIGGSGGLTLLLLSTITDKVEAAAALLLFAAGTALSMAFLSTAFGFAIAGGPVGKNFERVAPMLGVLSLAFGAWYALGALGLVLYPF
jgi:ABC-type nickel/cobalt efflux system permease component RcnA